MDTKEAKEFFEKFRIKLKLTTAYNPEGNGKEERGHPPIVNALAKPCDRNLSKWSNLLPLALLADRMTCSSVTGFVSAELMSGHLPLMPLEENICSWRMVGWEDEISREQLLVQRMEHFGLLPAKLEVAKRQLKMARLRNKGRFDRVHRLRPVPIQEGDWVLVFDSRLENHHLSENKFARRWHGPYVVVKVHSNATYTVRELDGTVLRVPFVGKRVKIFKRRISDGVESSSNLSDSEDSD
ncbi:unnamed protein product [Calypogeia fissa]